MSSLLVKFLAVACGGAIGACLRYASLLLSSLIWKGSFPLGTLLVNTAGAFCMGFIATRHPAALSETVKLFLLTGILGGFTTFSAFTFDFYRLISENQFCFAFLYVSTTLLLPLATLLLGIRLAQ